MQHLTQVNVTWRRCTTYHRVAPRLVQVSSSSFSPKKSFTAGIIFFLNSSGGLGWSSTFSMVTTTSVGKEYIILKHKKWLWNTASFHEKHILCIIVLSRRWQRNCHEKACPWQRKAKSLSEKNYCSLSWVTLRGHKRLVLFFFWQVMLWRSTLLYTH